MASGGRAATPDFARETPAGARLPYARHIDDRTIALRDGALMQVIQLDGLPFETVDTQELNYRKELRDAMLRAIGSSRFALCHHVVRRQVAPAREAAFPDPFSARIDRMWNERLANRQLYANDLFLTLVRRPIGTRAGMAGWLASRHGTQLAMSPLEYYMLRALVPELGHGEPPELRAFYRAAGWSEAELDEVLAGLGAFGQIVAPLPSQFAALREGQRLTIGARSWEVLMGQGHSPQHALLHCAADGLLISGDQVLPDISSNVSVYPQEPAADPLSDWLASLAAIRRRVPDDTLVLPAHGRPFRGLHARIDALIDGHERGLARLHARLTEPQRAVDVFGALFRQKIGPRTLQMATGECLAHLACLGTRGLATCAPDAAGIGWWQAAPAPAPHADNA